MKIVSFNINSIRARLENVLTWIKEANPDIVLLQELKCTNCQFPYAFFEDLGYNVAVHGQKSWNGVAILSKFSLEDVTYGLPNLEDIQSRYLEAFTGGVRVASCYMPYGSPLGSPKYEYKIKWMKAMTEHFKTLQTYDEPVIVGGDYNVVPTNNDAKKPVYWFEKEPTTQPEIREIFFDWQKMGWLDALRFLKPNEIYYTYWDYFRGAFEGDKGILLDFFFLNEKAKAMLKDGGIDKTPRAQSKPSDHTPIWIELE